MKDDVLHIDTDGHISIPYRHDYLRQYVLQFFGYIDGLAIFQSVETDEKRLIITFVSLSLLGAFEKSFDIGSSFGRSGSTHSSSD